TAALDYLVALGTHLPMSDAQLTQLIGKPVVDGVAGRRRIFNHRWDDPHTFLELGSIPASDVIGLTGGRLREPVVVALNRLVAEAYCGAVHDAWRDAAALSARRHIIWVDHPFDCVLSVMPAMYDDLWTAAKGAYKTEPAIRDGGEVIVYASQVDEVSHVHGRI